MNNFFLENNNINNNNIIWLHDDENKYLTYKRNKNANLN